MSGRALTAFAGIFFLAVGATAQETDGAAQARRERLRNGPQVRASQGDGVPEGTGTVQYDPGAPADGFLIALGPTYLFGNRFDTRNGSPLSPGTVTQVSWYQGALGTAGLGMTAFVRGGPLGAPFTFGATASNVVAFTFNSVPVSATVTGAFFVALRNSSLGNGPPGPWGSLGQRSATTNAQGFHGIQRNNAGTVSNALPNQNAMVRISGNVIIPVELMEFEVE